LATQTVTEGVSLIYTLPVITDPELDSCSIKNIVSPVWCTYDSNLKKFTIAPPPLTMTGTYKVSFDLSDAAQ